MRSSSGTASATGPSRSLTQALEEGYAQHQLVLDRQRHSKRIEGGIDDALMASVRASLAQLEKIARAGLVDEDMPRCVQGIAERQFDEFWIHFREYIEDEVYENKSLERAGNRKSLASSTWSSSRTCWPNGRGACPAPGSWFRAKLLYSLCPADRSFWQVFQSPSFWTVLVLTVLPLYGISVYTYALLFVLIERTDEFQLVSFICRFKAIQFVVQGLLPALFISAKHVACLEGQTNLLPESCTAVPAYVVAELLVEPLRVGVVWLAYGLLACGHAHGGAAQRAALEMRRLDVADGALDGVMSGRSGSGRAGSGTSNGGGTSGGRSKGISISKSQMRSAHRAALNALGAAASSVRSGGALPYFMLYDVCVTVLITLVLCAVIVRGGLLSRLDANGQPSLWLFWENVALAREMHALLSFPFVVFLMPMTLQLLTHVQPTGYDKSGLLCQALSSTQIRLIRKERQRQRRGVPSFALPVLDAGLDPPASSSVSDSNGCGGTLNQERVWTELL